MNNFINSMTERANLNPKKIAFHKANNIDILKIAEKVISTSINWKEIF